MLTQEQVNRIVQEVLAGIPGKDDDPEAAAMRKLIETDAAKAKEAGTHLALPFDIPDMEEE